MGSGEFAEWQVMFANEQLHPSIAQARHGQLLAAIYTGQAKPPQGQKGHRAADFMARDPWAPPAAKEPQLTPAQLKAQVASVNAMRKNRHGH
jgi:hypothetical protein